MTKILVTGANGQLGSELRQIAVNKTQYEWIFTDYQELDLWQDKHLPFHPVR